MLHHGDLTGVDPNLPAATVGYGAGQRERTGDSRGRSTTERASHVSW